ncbi:hypothetical protein Dimus_023074 [Dionaea muscipula]
MVQALTQHIEQHIEQMKLEIGDTKHVEEENDWCSDADFDTASRTTIRSEDEGMNYSDEDEYDIDSEDDDVDHFPSVTSRKNDSVSLWNISAADIMLNSLQVHQYQCGHSSPRLHCPSPLGELRIGPDE